MKFQSAAFSVGLGVISNLFSISLFPGLLLSSSRVLSQEVPPACPLSAEIAVTFLDSKCQKVELKEPKTFYRYYSESGNKYGRYLTTDQYKTNVEVIKNLALNQSWGNKATLILKVILPAGTVTYQGIVGPQTPTQCYPGGGQQTFIENTRDPAIQWVEETNANYAVEKFTCP